MIFEELIDDDEDEFVDEIDWDDDALIDLDEDMAAQGGDGVGLNFCHGMGSPGDDWA